MRKKRKKYGVLTRTDHRLDMSPAGRNLFVSRDKERQHREAKRIHAWIRVVLALTIVAACVAAALVAVFYLAPWFQSELTVSGSSSQAASEAPVESAPVYDAMGLVVYGEDVSLFVVNESSPADRDFEPELTEVSGVSVDSRVAPALRLLVSAAREDGLALTFAEGYVSYEEQEKRFDAAVEELEKTRGLSAVMARSEAASQTPPPGQCDFQSGMCIRVDGDPETFDTSRTWSWLKSNMGKFGFVFRYPEYKEASTGVDYDPTVIRYVGSECASAMQQRSMCLEEYISYLDSQ